MDPMHLKLAADMARRPLDPEALYTRSDMALWVWLRRAGAVLGAVRPTSAIRRVARDERVRHPV